MKKIILILATTGPLVRDNGLTFTAGGQVHDLFALMNLTSDYDISILCPNPPGEEQKRTINFKGIEIIYLGESRWTQWLPIGSLQFFKESYEYIREGKPDILIGDGVLASLFIRLFPETPFKVGIIHHLFHDPSANGSANHLVRMFGTLERLGLNLLKLDKIAVVNPMVKHILGKEGFCQDDIVIAGNGVDLDNYSFSDNKIARDLIYIGRLVELKRVSSLVEIITIIRDKIPDVVLHIVGDGPKHEEVERKIEALGMSDNVIMHGYVSEKEKIELLRISAIYVSNSSFEGFGIPLVEAMATGAVPVVSNIYAHRFVFQGNGVGYLVNNQEEMAARIIDLLTDETKRLQLAKIGRKLVEEKWTWAKVGEKYKELIQAY
jgi:glycosyltransferase involved in cell wall biosynthesis